MGFRTRIIAGIAREARGTGSHLEEDGRGDEERRRAGVAVSPVQAADARTSGKREIPRAQVAFDICELVAAARAGGRGPFCNARIVEDPD